MVVTGDFGQSPYTKTCSDSRDWRTVNSVSSDVLGCFEQACPRGSVAGEKGLSIGKHNPTHDELAMR